MESYRRLKSLAQRTRDDPIGLQNTLREIADYYVEQARWFGMSDGALCQSVGFPGFDAFAVEYQTLLQDGRYQEFLDRIISLAKQAGVSHTFRRQRTLITCHPKLTKVIESVVWKSTAEFRADYKALQKPPVPDPPLPEFYDRAKLEPAKQRTYRGVRPDDGAPSVQNDKSAEFGPDFV